MSPRDNGDDDDDNDDAGSAAKPLIASSQEHGSDGGTRRYDDDDDGEGVKVGLGLFMWILTFSAGVSGLLFGYEYVYFLRGRETAADGITRSILEKGRGEENDS